MHTVSVAACGLLRPHTAQLMVSVPFPFSHSESSTRHVGQEGSPVSGSPAALDGSAPWMEPLTGLAAVIWQCALPWEREKL